MKLLLLSRHILNPGYCPLTPGPPSHLLPEKKIAQVTVTIVAKANVDLTPHHTSHSIAPCCASEGMAFTAAYGDGSKPAAPADELGDADGASAALRAAGFKSACVCVDV